MKDLFERTDWKRWLQLLGCVLIVMIEMCIRDRSGKKPDKHLRMLVFFLKSKRSKGRMNDENLSRFVRRR